jgi:hypothetical protein
MKGEQSTITGVLAVLLFLYLLYWYTAWSSAPAPARRCRSRSPEAHRRTPEYFAPEEGQGTPVVSGQEQALLDFSDVLVTDAAREEANAVASDAAQIQTVNQRFAAAKRSVTENKLTTGVYNTKQRRKLVETLLRRPQCARRIRSWRTENSDYLRGDVRPRGTQGSSNLMRSAKSNPEIDLHPGALGPLSGMSGRWLSEEGLPGNVVPDGELVA